MMSVFVLTLSDVIGLIFFALLALAFISLWIPRMWKQYRCKHDGSIGEDQACNAWCHKCGKNLGFIGTWQQRQQYHKEGSYEQD